MLLGLKIRRRPYKRSRRLWRRRYELRYNNNKEPKKFFLKTLLEDKKCDMLVHLAEDEEQGEVTPGHSADIAIVASIIEEIDCAKELDIPQL